LEGGIAEVGTRSSESALLLLSLRIWSTNSGLDPTCGWQASSDWAETAGLRRVRDGSPQQSVYWQVDNNRSSLLVLLEHLADSVRFGIWLPPVRLCGLQSASDSGARPVRGKMGYIGSRPYSPLVAATPKIAFEGPLGMRNSFMHKQCAWCRRLTHPDGTPHGKAWQAFFEWKSSAICAECREHLKTILEEGLRCKQRRHGRWTEPRGFYGP